VSRRSGFPPLSADVAAKIRAWVDEMCSVAAGLTASAAEGDDRELLLAQLSVSAFVELYALDKQARLGRMAQDLGASNQSLAWACGITKQTASQRFPQPKRELPQG
jgi:hypothetical protein